MNRIPPVLIVLALVTGIALAGPAAAQDPGPPDVGPIILAAEYLPTTTTDASGAPPQSINLVCDGGFEFNDQCWQGWYDLGWGPQDRSNIAPFDGNWHLRQGWGNGVVRLYQLIDFGPCDPNEPVSVYQAKRITSDKPLDDGPWDATYTLFWSTDEWTNLAVISANTDQDRGDGYVDNWYRVEGLVQAANGAAYLSIETAFTEGPFPTWTTVDVDSIQVRCLPKGWQDPPHRTFVTIVMNGAGQ